MCINSNNVRSNIEAEVGKPMVPGILSSESFEISHTKMKRGGCDDPIHPSTRAF